MICCGSFSFYNTAEFVRTWSVWLFLDSRLIERYLRTLSQGLPS
jgi:hypothetical protein